MLLPLSSDGRWNRLLPIPLHQTVLDQFQLAPTAEPEEQPIAMLEAFGTETIGFPPLPDLGLDTIEEF